MVKQLVTAAGCRLFESTKSPQSTAPTPIHTLLIFSIVAELPRRAREEDEQHRPATMATRPRSHHRGVRTLPIRDSKNRTLVHVLVVRDPAVQGQFRNNPDAAMRIWFTPC